MKDVPPRFLLLIVLALFLNGCGPSPSFPATPEALTPTPTSPTATAVPPTSTPAAPTSTPTPVPPTPTPPPTPTAVLPVATLPLTNRILPAEGYAIPLRGLWDKGNGAQPERTIRLAKEASANFILTDYWIEVDTSGNIAPLSTQSDVVSRIRAYHEAGLQVWLNIRTILAPIIPGEEGHELTFELNPDLFNGLADDAADRFLAQLESVVLEWAGIAQKEHMEIFTPVAAGQLYLVLKSERAFTWANSLVPRVREVYSGALVQKIDLNPHTQQLVDRDLSVISFEGWDYVSTDVFGSHGFSGPVRTYEQWTTFVRELLEIAESMDDRYETKGIILGPEIQLPESDAQTLQAGTEFWGRGELTTEEMERAKIRLWDILFQETAGRVEGYVFWNWMPGDDIVLLGLEKEKDGMRYTTRAPAGYQGVGPLELIAGYYSLDEQSLPEYLNTRRQQLITDYREEALAAIEAVEVRLEQQQADGAHTSYVESIRRKLDDAIEMFEAGEYLEARRLADMTYALTLEEMNPLGLLLDGQGDDWATYSAIATDPEGDAILERDLRTFHAVNDDQYLYLMVRLSTVNPISDLVINLDMNSDGQGDYHIRASSPDMAQLFESYSPSDHNPLSAVECVYDQVIELRIPLDSVGDPQSIGFEIASWDETQSDTADDFGDFSWNLWITYDLEED